MFKIKRYIILFAISFIVLLSVGCAPIDFVFDLIAESPIHTGLVSTITHQKDNKVVCFKDGNCYPVVGFVSIGDNANVYKSSPYNRIERVYR